MNRLKSLDNLSSSSTTTSQGAEVSRSLFPRLTSSNDFPRVRASFCGHESIAMIDYYGTGNPPVEHDYTHPERHYKGLIRYGDHGNTLNDPSKWRLNTDWGEPPIELCWACGWSTDEQSSSYSPRIHIMHTRRNMGLWSLGSKWLLCDRPNDETMGNNYMTWEFLRKHEEDHNIPLVKEMRVLTEPDDPIQFTVISRAQGVLLSSVWESLTAQQKSSYADQLVDILKQLRQFTASRPQKVNGDRLYDSVLDPCSKRVAPTCHKVEFTADEWLENMSEEIRCGIAALHETTDPELVEEKFREIKDNFPSGGPYVLTHGDLNFTNIIVKDDKIEAIIDWEYAGYLPWWAEKFMNRRDAPGESVELFNLVWPRVHPDLSDSSDRWARLVKQLSPVVEAIRRTRILHERTVDNWFRPAFCECKPYGGEIHSFAIGGPWKHRVIDWRNDEYSGLVNITLHKGEKKLDWDERDELLRKEKEIAEKEKEIAEKEKEIAEKERQRETSHFTMMEF